MNTEDEMATYRHLHEALLELLHRYELEMGYRGILKDHKSHFEFLKNWSYKMAYNKSIYDCWI